MQLKYTQGMDNANPENSSKQYVTVEISRYDILENLPQQTVKTIIQRLTDKILEHYEDEIIAQVDINNIANLITKQISEKLAEKAVDNLLK